MADGNPGQDRSNDTLTPDDGDGLRSSLMAAFVDENTTTDNSTAEAPSDAPQDPEGADEGAAGTDEPAAAEASEEGDEPTDDRETSGEDEVDAPATWSKPDQEMFKKLPAEAREFIQRRHSQMEADYTRKNQEIAPLRQQVTQWDAYLKQIGAKPEQAWDALMRTEYTLRMGTSEQRVDAIQRLMKQYKVELPIAQKAAAEAEPELPVHPAVKALQQQVEQLNGTLTQAQQRELERAQQEQQSRAATLSAEIEAFREAKTEAGESAHPYFDEVQDHMARLVLAARQAGDPIPPLQELYDAAVWANPSTRQQLLADQRKAEERKRDAERQKKARAAQKAGSSLSSTPTGGDGGVELGLREQLEKLMTG